MFKAELSEASKSLDKEMTAEWRVGLRRLQEWRHLIESLEQGAKF